MSNEKAKEWIKSAREIQNFIAGTTSDHAQIGFITGVISRESESYADQETATLKERVEELKFMIDNGLGWKDMENDNKPV